MHGALVDARLAEDAAATVAVELFLDDAELGGARLALLHGCLRNPVVFWARIIRKSGDFGHIFFLSFDFFSFKGKKKFETLLFLFITNNFDLFL